MGSMLLLQITGCISCQPFMMIEKKMYNRMNFRKLVSRGVVSFFLGIVLLACVGCGEQEALPPPPAKVEKTEPPPPTTEAEEPPKPSPTPYDPAGRREPFKSLIVEEVPAAEKVILTPEPDEILSPLQEFELEELKLTGIIIGGLGDYARVRAPDGKSYTINVGTLMGKHEGKVISISDNIVLVKETFRYEGGDVEEVETPIYLNPIEEEKSP